MAITYTTLNSDVSEIRLLRIEPGEQGDSLICSVSVVSLDNKPKYEALSYVWGDASLTVDITVDGNLHPVTRNLNSALQSLRSPLSPRVIWADAICINQVDILEKNSQIPLMGRIYTEAAEVIGCPGIDGTPELEFFAEWAEVYNSNTPKCFSLKWAMKHGLSWLTPRRYMKYQLFNLRLLKAEYAFWWTEYFQRMWTVQELALAKNPPVFVIGQKSFRFRTSKWIGQYSRPQKYRPIVSGAGIYKFFNSELRNKLEEELLEFSNTYDPASNSARLVAARYGFQNPGLGLPTLLQSTSHRKCFNPRDRIFALYSLAPGLEAAYPADYRKPPEQVLMDTICYLLEHYPEHLEFLVLSWPLRNTRLEDSDSYPSWLPDLTRHQPAGFYPWGYTRAQETRVPPSIDGYKNQTVEVSGIHKQLNYACLGHDFVGSIFDPYELYNELSEEDPTADVQHEDVWSVLDTFPLYKNKSASLTNKKAFMASSGLFGICSEEMQDGDHLMVSPWLPIPALTRKRDDFRDENGRKFAKLVDFTCTSRLSQDDPQEEILRLVKQKKLKRIRIG
ncbi:unnamed protein product [Clonostachys byssicola]|uniref:Heterokaryon incompatibility domain-containing protein n=1 Tax=Clonostachys byssicola TaxID=160290 RepID=A0A9N9USF7_9HYPO|nr:unnamed protein product [Clonostachys byssicola]